MQRAKAVVKQTVEPIRNPDNLDPVFEDGLFGNCADCRVRTGTVSTAA
jgi:hypothetical protein